MGIVARVGFLFTRRWLVFAVVVALLAWLAVALGDWQFRRLAERKEANATLIANLQALPVPVDSLMRIGRDAPAGSEWRTITATGTWDTENTVVVRYRTLQGKPGVEVVTPLRTPTGTVIVDRGWLRTANEGNARPDLPDLDQGTVTVTGHVRVNATGSSAQVDNLSTRAVSSSEIAKHLAGQQVYGGFVQLAKQSPPSPSALVVLDIPEVNEGPHFFYGLQWWFFGALAVVGFFYLLYDEIRRRRSEPTT